MARIKSLSLSMLIRVLDVGCGDMTLARGLLDQVEGIDLACFDIHPPTPPHPPPFSNEDQ